jgi:hypothetical protein
MFAVIIIASSTWSGDGREYNGEKEKERDENHLGKRFFFGALVW